jgi:hypothetical protein
MKVQLLIIFMSLHTTSAQQEMKEIYHQFDEVRYEIGNPEFRGQTSVTISKVGDVALQFTRGGQTDTYAGSLSTSEMEEFKRLLADAKVCEIDESAVEVQPDDVKAQIQIRTAEEQCSNEFWESQKYQNPQLSALIGFLNKMMMKISAGKVKY